MSKKILCIFFLTFICGHLYSQTPTIAGKVVDAKTGETLPGASVLVKGTAFGAATDIDGNFTIAYAPNPGDSLVVNYTGYFSQTLALGNSVVFTIAMNIESEELQEVVVIGYEIVNKRDVQSSVSSIRAREIRDIPITDAAQAITGRLAGVQVTTSEGGPGAAVNIRVRGGGSLSQDNSPIYIVDGMQLDNALQTLNPQDIESIDVLKDAAATAIYGARGANGVVIITTKSGRSGKTIITYNGAIGTRQIYKQLDVLNPYDFALFRYERDRFGTDSTDFRENFGSTFDTLNAYKNYAGTDWQGRVIGRNAPYYNNNLSIAGGNEKTNYSLSLTSNNEKGVMLGSDFDRKLINFKLNHIATERLTLGFNVRFMDQQVTGSGTGAPPSGNSSSGQQAAGSSSLSRLRHIVQYTPIDLLNDQSGEDLATNSNTLINPEELTAAEYQQRTTDNININGSAGFNILKNLNFKSTLGYNYSINRDEYFYGKITQLARQTGNQPIARIRNQKSTTLNNSNVLMFNKKGINRIHDLTALVGHEIYETGFNYDELQAQNLPTDISADKALNNLGLGALSAGWPRSDAARSKLLSFFSKVSYSLRDRYLFSFSLRADGSSKFAKQNRWGYFPAGSLAWRFSQEGFWNKPAFLTEGKFRLSYGMVGNNRIDDFLFTPLFSTDAIYYLGTSQFTAYNSPTIANANLKWETTVSRNLGLDLSFFSNRIQFTADVYQNSVRDLLLDTPIPTTSGYTSQLQNVGETTNKGLELQLNATMIKSTNLSWTTGFNISFNRNTIKSLGIVRSKEYSSEWQNANQLADFIVQVGQPVGQMYGFVTEGFYGVDDFNYSATTRSYTPKEGGVRSSLLGTPAPGTIRIKDIDGNDTINSKDRTVIGNATPKFIGGFNNQFAFKNFDFSIFLNWVFGNDVYNANKVEFTSGYNNNSNVLEIMDGRWRSVNDNGERVTEPEALRTLNANATMWREPVNNTNTYYMHSWAVEDGSFLRVNNITFGYTLPKKVIEKIYLSNLRVYATVNNVYTFTRYTGFDPEVNTRTRTPLTPAVDYSAYPRSRTFVVGLNVTF